MQHPNHRQPYAPQNNSVCENSRASSVRPPRVRRGNAAVSGTNDLGTGPARDRQIAAGSFKWGESASTPGSISASAANRRRNAYNPARSIQRRRPIAQGADGIVFRCGKNGEPVTAISRREIRVMDLALGPLDRIRSGPPPSHPWEKMRSNALYQKQSKQQHPPFNSVGHRLVPKGNGTRIFAKLLVAGVDLAAQQCR